MLDWILVVARRRVLGSGVGGYCLPQVLSIFPIISLYFLPLCFFYFNMPSCLSPSVILARLLLWTSCDVLRDPTRPSHAAVSLFLINYKLKLSGRISDLWNTETWIFVRAMTNEKWAWMSLCVGPMETIFVTMAWVEVNLKFTNYIERTYL